MKIVVLFRSKERSNDICSATKHQLTKSKFTDYINVDFVNLDKRNLQKYMISQENIDIIYLWHDEEIAMNYIKENYPNIKIVNYDHSEKTISSNWYGGNSYKYILADKLIEEYKETTGMITIYEFNTGDCSIKKSKITNYDYENNKKFKTYFTEKEQAEEYAKKYIKDEIQKIEKSIEMQRKRLINYKKFLKKYEKDSQ